MTDAYVPGAPSIEPSASSQQDQTSLLQIRCISLVGSPRRQAMAAQLDELGLPWSFFDARTAPPTDIPYDEARTKRFWGQALTKGELGVYASHYELWKSVAADNGPSVLLVIEDDVWLDPTFFAHDAALVQAARQYGYLRLIATVPTAMQTEAEVIDRFVARIKGRCFGTQAYLITRPAARRLLASIKRITRPIDDEIDRYWIHGVLNRVIYPFPVLGKFPIMSMNFGGEMKREPMQEKGAWWLFRRGLAARDRLHRHIADLTLKIHR